MGIENIQEKFFEWLIKRAESWQETGLFYQQYYPNGLKDFEERDLQIDQTGTVLIALYHHFKNKKGKSQKYKKLAINSAHSLCKIWQRDHFTFVVQDFWEERFAFPDLKENFCYSLSACIKELLATNELFHADKKFLQTAVEMKKVLLKNVQKRGYIFRSFGKLNDKRIDASALGLIWPFEIFKPDDSIVQKTVELIENKLIKITAFIDMNTMSMTVGWLKVIIAKKELVFGHFLTFG